MSKYEPLAKKLGSLPRDEWRTNFQALERLLGFPLPKAARTHRAWWSNNGSNNVMTKVWLSAGWRTEQVDMEGETLVFRKAKAMKATVSSRSARLTGTPPVSLFGALAGTVHVASGVDLTAPAGEQWHADQS